VLIVTSGFGMVATEHEQHEINVGDVVQDGDDPVTRNSRERNRFSEAPKA
jgi:hypothetical protein